MRGFNATNGADLESDYRCFFECKSMGIFMFAVSGSGDRYELEISANNTNKLTTNLEEYVCWVEKISDGKTEKLLSGRIHLDKRIKE